MTTTRKTKTSTKSKSSGTKAKAKAAGAGAVEILQEYGPYPGIDHIHGVTYDGENIWFATGESLMAVDPKNGKRVRKLEVIAEAGTAYDGKYLWQIADERIQKIDPRSGKVVNTIPAPSHGRDSGLTWAEGTLWVGEYRARKIRQIDAETGAILRTFDSDRFVTGVSWANDELWHATLEDGKSDIRRINPKTGKVLEKMELPTGVTVSGMETDGAGVFYCGGSSSGKIRVVRRVKS